MKKLFYLENGGVVRGNAWIKLCMWQRTAWDMCEKAAFLPPAGLRAIAAPEVAWCQLCLVKTAVIP